MRIIKKKKERVMSIALVFVMVIALLAGMPATEVQAATFKTPIIDRESITLYNSGCLKDITITVQASGSYATAYGRIGIHSSTTSYDWDHRFTTSSNCTSWPAESEFISKDPSFVAFASGEEFLWTDCQQHTITFTFADGKVDLSKNQTYHIYLWTRASAYGIYTDAHLGTLQTTDGKLLDENGNTLIEVPENTETPGTEDKVSYVFNYAYDCQRSPAYPKKGASVRLSGFQNPLGASQSAGKWEITDCGKYDSSIHTERLSESIANVVSSLARQYGVSNSEINVFDLQKDGQHICYGVVATVFEEGILFIGTTWSGGGGYYICNKALSSSDVVNDTAIGDATEIPTPGSTSHTHTMVVNSANAATCTKPGNIEYYSCSDCGKLYSDANGNTEITLENTVIRALGHDWSGTWTTIKEATAKVDGKKETLCVRGCGQKKVATIPATGTSEDNSNSSFEKDAEVAPDAPIEEVTLNNSKAELLETGNIFSDTEKQLIASGTDARVWLEVNKKDESTISTSDKSKIEEAAAGIMGENLNITYFDAELFKQVGNDEKKTVSEPGMAIEITIKIPDELLNTDNKIAREYKIIRLHEGETEPTVISGTYNAKTKEFTFETNKFSTYAIIYGDSPVKNNNPAGNTNPSVDINLESGVKDEVPKTGESNLLSYSFILMVLSVAGIFFSTQKKKSYK